MTSRFPMSVVDWLREGYPTGIPRQDTLPILALLRRRLTDDEVTEIADELSSQGLLEIDRSDIGAEITKVTDELPRTEDLDRVQDHLAFRGFPVSDADSVDDTADNGDDGSGAHGDGDNADQDDAAASQGDDAGDGTGTLGR